MDPSQSQADESSTQENFSSVPLDEDKERADRRRKKNTYKRLVIFCDGTGQQTDSAGEPPKKNGSPPQDATPASWDDWVPSSNVTRLARVLLDAEQKPDGDEIEQISFYQNGVGTSALGWVSKNVDGAFGYGLNENVCEAYVWLCMNWIPGDEIFLFGFSRGAFTARAIAGVIGALGIIQRSSLGGFHTIYDIYSKRYTKEYAKAWAELSHPDGGNVQTGMRAPGNVRIKVVGVWDTVKSLGIPETAYAKGWSWNEKYSFHDAFTCDHVDNAFHALALDERRPSFSPTLWFLPPDGKSPTNLRQIWFPGVHSDVGGSYSDSRPFDSSDLSLLWMLEQIKSMLVFDVTRLYTGFLPDSDLDKAKDGNNWVGAQPLHESYGVTWGLPEVRKPGQYKKMENVQKPTDKVGPQNEYVHWSVRLRAARAKSDGVRVGPKKEGWKFINQKDKKDERGWYEWELAHKYDCQAMKGFHLERGNNGYIWVKEGKGKERIVLEEEPLSQIDLDFLYEDSDAVKLLKDEKFFTSLRFD